MTQQQVLGIDIGGSGMKAGIVDVGAGEMITKRHRIETPEPAAPEPMTAVFAELVAHFDWTGPIGCTFPGVVRGKRTIETAANLDPSWVGVDAAATFGSVTDSHIVMVNDADAAGVAEMRFGAGRGQSGVVALITVGTGLGTAVFNDGDLVPNTELGHIEINGVDAEEIATSRIIDELDLSLDEWAPRLGTYLRTLENLIWPDLFLIGGGISKQFDGYAHLIETRTPVRPAAMRNKAGIIGAALLAE